MRFSQVYALNGHTKVVSALSFSDDGKTLASSSADSTIRLWSMQDGASIEIRGHMHGISDVCWIHDGSGVISASDDRTARVWDAKTVCSVVQHIEPDVVVTSCMTLQGALTHTLDGHVNAVACVDSNRMNPYVVATGGYDDCVRIWDLRAKNCLHVLPAHSDAVVSVAFSNDGMKLLSGSYDSVVRVWDVAAGACLHTTVDDQSAAVSSTCFAPNDQYVLISSLDNTIRLWDYQKQLCIREYSGHKHCDHACRSVFGYSGKTQWLASGSESGELVLWEVDSTSEIARLKCNHDVVLDVAFHRSGKLAFGGIGGNNQVVVWAVGNDA